MASVSEKYKQSHGPDKFGKRVVWGLCIAGLIIGAFFVPWKKITIKNVKGIFSSTDTVAINERSLKITHLKKGEGKKADSEITRKLNWLSEQIDKFAEENKNQRKLIDSLETKLEAKKQTDTAAAPVAVLQNKAPVAPPSQRKMRYRKRVWHCGCGNGRHIYYADGGPYYGTRN